LIYLEIYIG